MRVIRHITGPEHVINWGLDLGGEGEMGGGFSQREKKKEGERETKTSSCG